MIWVLVIFVPPLIMAATMLSPQGLGYTIHAVIGYSGITLLLLPIAAWPLFFNPSSGPAKRTGSHPGYAQHVVGRRGAVERRNEFARLYDGVFASSAAPRPKWASPDRLRSPCRFSFGQLYAFDAAWVRSLG